MQPSLDELWEIVRSIPRGRVMSYGDVGRSLRYPSSGFQVGRWMTCAPEGVPWWRVVAQTGRLPLSKRSPILVLEQVERLKAEGVPFIEEGVVNMDIAGWDFGS
jgi:methylated-DNA-protein-cysteine methyltransferase-like protein